jgi:hypothetical protein
VQIKPKANRNERPRFTEHLRQAARQRLREFRQKKRG